MTAAQFLAFQGSAPAREAAAKPAIKIPKPLKMRQGEDEYLRLLSEEFPTCQVRFGAVKFRLHAGTLYTPDMTVWCGNILVLAVEVKGGKFIHKGASLEKVKQLVSEFKMIPFRFAQKIEGRWEVVNVNQP